MTRTNAQPSADNRPRTSRRGKTRSACARGLLAVPLMLSTLTDVSAQPAQPESRPNVLMIISDDLRPELPSYGVERAHAPNLTQLASQSVVFSRAYCQTPVCGPSRASFLTGLRPEGERFRTNQDHVKKQTPNAETIPGHFKDHGYETRAFGKVFHNSNDMDHHWSRPRYHAPKTNESWRRYQTEENIQHENTRDQDEPRGPAVEVAPNDVKLRDTHIADAVIEEMTLQHETGQPFMLVAGFIRPHLPFIAPKKDWDRYPPESIELPTSGIPKGAEPAGHNFGELRSYGGIPPQGELSDEKAVELVRGYLASVSHVDREIGRLLDALDRLGIADDTIVVVFGDHGWFLREHGLWSKHSTFHEGIRVPLMVRAPGIEPARSDALVELVDVFPTLTQLADLPMLRQFEGNSFVPVLHEPGRDWKDAVFTRFYNLNTVVTERYAYTAFENSGKGMAFDLVEDPVETTNLTLDQSQAQTVAELEAALEKGWRHYRPGNTPTAALVDDAAEMLRARQSPSKKDRARRFTIPFTNDRFDAPVTLNLSTGENHGPGWQIDLGDGRLTVPPGETGELHIRVEQRAKGVRYPLPTLQASVKLAAGGHRTQPIRAESEIELPLIGSQPTLAVAPVKSEPQIDGKLDDKAWRDKPDVPLLGRMDREQSIAPPTQAWAKYDENALYVAFRCHEPNMDRLKLDATKRDANVFRDDSVEIMIEPDGDGEGRDYRQVILSAANVVFDGKGFDNSITLPGLKTATSQGENTWTAEIAIPWTAIGLDDPPKQAGILLGRNRQVTGNMEVFQFPLSPAGNHQPAMFATLRLTK